MTSLNVPTIDPCIVLLHKGRNEQEFCRITLQCKTNTSTILLFLFFMRRHLSTFLLDYCFMLFLHYIYVHFKKVLNCTPTRRHDMTTYLVVFVDFDASSFDADFPCFVVCRHCGSDDAFVKQNNKTHQQ